MVSQILEGTCVLLSILTLLHPHEHLLKCPSQGLSYHLWILTTQGFTAINSMLRKMIFKIVFNICKGTYKIQHAHSIPNLTPYTIAFTPTIRVQTIL